MNRAEATQRGEEVRAATQEPVTLMKMCVDPSCTRQGQMLPATAFQGAKKTCSLCNDASRFYTSLLHDMMKRRPDSHVADEQGNRLGPITTGHLRDMFAAQGGRCAYAPWLELAQTRGASWQAFPDLQGEGRGSYVIVMSGVGRIVSSSFVLCAIEWAGKGLSREMLEQLMRESEAAIAEVERMASTS